MKNLIIIFCILLTSCTMKEVKKTPETKINIQVKHNTEVLLNGDRVTIEEIAPKLLEIKSNDTINERELYVVYLDVDTNTNADVVMGVKQQLRKANMLKIKQSTN